MLYILSGIYFLFGAISFLQGNLVVASNSFQGIFSVEEQTSYQGINVYLGLFTLLNITMLDFSKKFILIIKLIISILAVFLMFLIGGRSGITSLVVTMAFYIYLSHYHSKSKVQSFGVIFFLAICLIIGSSYIMDFLSTTVAYKRFTVLSGSDDSSQRIFLFTKAIELFLSNCKTLLFGGGINFYPVYINAYSTGMYPHNILLELLAEYGIVGTSLFLAPIIYVIKMRKDSMGAIYGNTQVEKTIFLFAIYFWTIHMFTGGLRTSWVLIFFTFLLVPSRLVRIENTRADWWSWYNLGSLEAELELCGALTTIPYVQDNILIEELRKRNRITEDAVFISGNSGDFIEGGHIDKTEGAVDVEKMVDSIRRKHMRLNHLRSFTRLEDAIRDEIQEFRKSYNTTVGFDEYWEWKERQSKFVSKCVKPYELAGFEWRMPFWDTELLEFWKSVPCTLKGGRQLFYSYAVKYMNMQLPLANPEIPFLSRYRDVFMDGRYGCFLGGKPFAAGFFTLNQAATCLPLREKMMPRPMLSTRINGLIAQEVFSRIQYYTENIV